jgi:hypothetical protein
MKINLSIETNSNEQDIIKALSDYSFSYQMLVITLGGLPPLESTQVDLGEGKYRFDINMECNESHIKTLKKMFTEMGGNLNNEIYNY